jgi:hypoxanthine phosphoribosyltransferase
MVRIHLNVWILLIDNLRFEEDIPDSGTSLSAVRSEVEESDPFELIPGEEGGEKEDTSQSCP